MELINNNIRGGTSCIFQPFARANNVKLLPVELPQHLQHCKSLHDDVVEGDPHDWTTLPTEYADWCKENGFDHTKETSWIAYVDVNSLYPTCMTMKLPIGDYKEETLFQTNAARLKHIDRLLKSYRNEDDRGYFVEES